MYVPRRPLSCRCDVKEQAQPVVQLDPAQRRWLSVLEAAAEGLRGGQLFLWNEAARKVEALLACPAAFDGEAFAQVLLGLHLPSLPLGEAA